MVIEDNLKKVREMVAVVALATWHWPGRPVPLGLVAAGCLPKLLPFMHCRGARVQPGMTQCLWMCVKAADWDVDFLLAEYFLLAKYSVCCLAGIDWPMGTCTGCADAPLVAYIVYLL